MTQDKDQFEDYSVLSEIKLSPHEREDVWNSIEQGMKHTRIYKEKRGFTMIKTSAAVVAALAIFGGGIGYEVHHTGLNNKPGVTTASDQTNSVSSNKLGVTTTSNHTNSVSSNKPSNQPSANNSAKSVKSTDPKVLFANVPFTTKVPKDAIAERIDSKASTNIRFYNTTDAAHTIPDKQGYFEIVYPKNKMTSSEVTAWVKSHSGSKPLPKVTVPKSVHSPFIETYQAYTSDSNGGLTFQSIQVGQHNGQYFFVLSSYPSDMADMMTAYENDVLSYWVWQDTGKRFAPDLPQSSTNQGP